jgi:Flp pilus assembly pilin Flp
VAPSQAGSTSADGPQVRRPRRGWSALLRDEAGAEQMEYLLIFAGVVLPLIVASDLMWQVLLYNFTLESFVIDLPLF